jgi:hypothetical protein
MVVRRPVLRLIWSKALSFELRMSYQSLVMALLPIYNFESLCQRSLKKLCTAKVGLTVLDVVMFKASSLCPISYVYLSFTLLSK